MEKYNGRYRIPSARAPWKNYADQGAYFVSINTKHRAHFFGHIENGIMCLSKIGSIAYNEWLNTLSIRPDMNLTLHAHVVMPDHFHAVLSIGANVYNDGVGMGRDLGVDDDRGMDQDLGMDRDLGKDALQCVSTPLPLSTPTPPATPSTSSAFGPQRKNLAAIMRGYKSTVTVQSRKINPNFGWQTRYHDRIVPDQRALNNIIKYIKNNPAKWAEKTR